MQSSSERISARTLRLNAQIIGKSQNGNKLINREALLDTLQALYDECSIENLQKVDKNVALFYNKHKQTLENLKRVRINIADFEIKNVIGRGHFGEVHLVKEKQTDDIYAMKTIRKSDCLEKTSFEIERNIMAIGGSSLWLTSLQYAFQDQSYLFYVMEYHPGGDLLGLLYRHGGTLPESAATFYLAELVLALEDLHKLGYIHRDIKPDNVLLDRCGHLKLVDFGSASKMNDKGLASQGPPVGTPDYVAPEVLKSVEDNSSYGTSCDFWSLGILAFELTVGSPPFTGQNSTTIYSKIMNFSKHLKFPPDIVLSQAYVSFVKNLICDVKNRLDLKQIKEHKIFKNIHFDTLRDQVPPHVPKITSVDDTSNFCDILAKKKEPSIENFKKKKEFSGRNLPFIGFTYTPDINGFEHQNHERSNSKDEIIKSLNKQIVELQQKIVKNDDIEGIKINLEKQLEEKLIKLESIESVRDKLERDLATNIAECTALKRTLEIERKDRVELEKKALDLIKSAKQKWENSERCKIEKLALEIEHKNEKIDQLTMTNNLLQDQLKNAFKVKDKHKSNLDKMEQITRRSVIGLESRLEKVTVENKERITNLQIDLNNEIHENELLRQQLENSKRNEADARITLRETEEHCEKTREQLNEFEDLVNQLVQKVAQLEDELKECVIYKKECDQLNSQLNEARQDIKDLKNKITLQQQQRQELVESKKIIENLETTIRANEKKIEDLRLNLENEQENSSKLIKQLQQLGEKNNDNQELRELRTKYWRLEKDFNNSQIDKRIAERELKEVEAQNKEQKLEIGQLKTQLETNKKIHEQSIMELERMNESITTELITTRQQLLFLQGKIDSEKEKRDQDKMLLDELRDVIRSKDKKIAEVALETDKIKLQKVENETNYKLLQIDNAKLMEKLNDMKKEKSMILAELENTRQQMENTKLNWEALKEACMLLENQVVEYEKINSSLIVEKNKINENTQKLIKDLCDAKQEIQEAKKLANEQKSLRLLAENKIKRLKEDISNLETEIENGKQQLAEFKQYSNNLAGELTNVEEKATNLEVTLKNYERQIERYKGENNLLKEDLSQYLTQINKLKEHNYKLSHNITELKNNKTILLEKIYELEGVLNEKIHYYKEREVKADSTIKQQIKLIDYLQSKVDESAKKKTLADKLFGISKKENQPPAPLVMNYKELEANLQKERELNRTLHEEITKLKTEKIKKGESISPETKVAMQQLTQSPPEFQRKNSVQRMGHNIPHRFESKLCKKLSRCEQCDNQIMLGRSFSVCKECGLGVHPHCAASVKGTCGLPVTYAKHFKNSLTQLNESKENNQPDFGNLEGWIKVSGKNGWEKRFATIANNKMQIFTKHLKERGELIETIDLKPENSSGKVILEPLESEIGTNVATSDLPFVMKIEINTEANCWPSTTFIFMALSIQERDNWFRALQERFQGSVAAKYQLETVIRLPKEIHVNCVTDLTKNIKILGTEQGLYSFYNNALSPIEALNDIHQITLLPHTNQVLMIGGENSVLIHCDLNHLMNLSQCEVHCAKLKLNYKQININNFTGYHFLEVSKIQLFCVATTKQLIIVKYDCEDCLFIPLRILDTAEPTACALFTEHTLIVGADKFFEIDLKTFKAEEFLDGSDLNLKPALKCAKIGSYPLAILHVKDNPKEYLLCFSELSVFVDEYGRCSRSEEIKINHLPVGFHYIDPYLYIILFSGVEIVKILNKFDGFKLELDRMRFVGLNRKGIYIKHNDEIKLVEGRKLLDADEFSLASESTEDRFSFTSSVVQSLDGNLSDSESNDGTLRTRRVQFEQAEF